MHFIEASLKKKNFTKADFLILDDLGREKVFLEKGLVTSIKPGLYRDILFDNSTTARGHAHGIEYEKPCR